MAFADTREYAYWYDQSGNNNDWTSEGGLTESDVMLDSPTNNFATLNPLDKGSITVSEGNTKAAYAAAHETILSTFSVSTGKHYFESYINASTSSGNFSGIGTNAGGILNSHVGSTATSWGYELSGDIWNNNIAVSGNASLATGDILGIAFDADANTITYYKNNTVQPQTHTGIASGTYSPQLSIFHSGSFIVANFGQDSSFAGNKTPQGNQDANGIGDFYYAPPTGFLALCTSNLPDVDVIPSENFNSVIYTGTGADNRVLSGVGFTPDLGIFKRRNGSGPPQFFDTLRGASQQLRSDSSAAESTQSNKQKTFTSDGYTLGTDAQINGSGGTYVAWNWKLGGSAVSNSNGSATSQVLANVDAGISIATFTLPTTATTIGHGLSKPPELIFQKGRVSGSAWWTFAKPLGNTKALRLDGSGAAATSTNFWNNTDPTSTVVTIGANSGGNNSWMMYCFHSVDGYSKIGSYKGTTVNAGSFVHTGFKVAFVLIKTMFDGDPWVMMDAARDPFNVATKRLRSDSSAAETTDAQLTCDFLSNGFKPYGNSYHINGNGQTYLYMAFAENPFKHSNAR